MFDLINRNRDQNYFDRFFDDMYPDGYEGKMMRVDIKENDHAYVIDVEVPGVLKEDIRLIVNDDVLTINVKRKEVFTTDNEKYLRRERKFGSMSRAFTIRDIAVDSISAKYENGVLHVTLPKITEEELDRTRMISID